MAYASELSEAELANYKEIFDTLDTDGDGVISHADLKAAMDQAGWGLSDEEVQAELGNYQEIFDALDTDGDGVISYADLKAALDQAGWGYSDEDVKGIIDRADVDGNGTVCWDEFLKMLAEKPPKSRIEATMRRMFRALDVDDSGFITPDNLRQVMGDAGVEMSEDEINSVIAQADVNGDGQISFEEFATIFHDM